MVLRLIQAHARDHDRIEQTLHVMVDDLSTLRRDRQLTLPYTRGDAVCACEPLLNVSFVCKVRLADAILSALKAAVRMRRKTCGILIGRA